MSRNLRRRRPGGPAELDQRASERGQNLTELAIVVPLAVFILLGIIEFGFLFNHDLTLEYATREGARTGAALANGTNEVPCANVDSYIVAAVERVIESPGSPVVAGNVGTITIFSADVKGANTLGLANTWTYRKAGGPAVNGKPLDWAPTTTTWGACGRHNGPAGQPFDSIGVSVQYQYPFVTALAARLGPIRISDSTVMSLNPKTPGS